MNKPVSSILVALLLSALLSKGAWASDTEPTRTEIKRKYIDSLNAAPASQFLRVRLADGRLIALQEQALLDVRGIRTEWLSGNSICVTIDRREAAIAGAAIDANIACQRVGFCDRLPDYVKALRTPEGEDQFVLGFKLIEEFDDRFTPDFANWTANKAYAAEWFGALKNFLITIQLHEIGHLALKHAPRAKLSAEEDVAREAMADGFAVYVTQLGGYSSDSGAALVLDAILDGAPHDYSSCRVQAFTLGLRAWVRKFFPNSKLIQSLPDVRVTHEYGGNFEFSGGLPELADNVAACLAYNKNLLIGVERAAQLVTPQTEIESHVENGKQCGQ